MEGADGTGRDDRTFRANFSHEGVLKLRENVKEKLKEYMGDYTDDTLVEYVMVLLKNGRSKDEARSELNVFLDDDSDSFVSWLWDHLGSNLNHYVQSRQSHSGGVLKTTLVTTVPAGGTDSHKIESESEKSKPDKSFKSQHSREWKGLDIGAGEQPRLRSFVADGIHTNRGSRKVGNAKRSVSPQPVVSRKRNRSDEWQQNKRELASQATIAAPRRLLQFAVRDAVATSKPSNLTMESSSKRLRSVVSTSTEDLNLQEHQHRIRPVAGVPNAMATAIKAVEEAAKDVRKTRLSTNVFDRLGRPSKMSDTLNDLSGYGVDPSEGEEDERLSFVYSNEYRGGVPVLQRDARMVVDPALDEDDYHVNAMGQGVVGISHIGRFGGKRGAETVQHQLGRNVDEAVDIPLKNRDQFGEVTSSKIVNASSHSNTWKSPHYQKLRGSLDLDNQNLVQENGALTYLSGMRAMKENSNPILFGNGNAIFEVDVQKESQENQSSPPGLHTIGGPTEDADTRTLFVNNVHFAATKDSLSRHFNNSGEVLKVVILTDAATGQPKGSAYIEFVRKEAAENALSLDGTSFMSRILRVVQKSSAQQEASFVMHWPRVVRASPYIASRLPRVPFPRGNPGLYRFRFPAKPGARSFQWKRETQSTPSGTSSPSKIGSPSFPRSLTYVRTEAKTNGS